jgi:DnaJ-class molecular chaperone
MRCPDCDQQGLRETSPDLNIGNGKCRACHGRGELNGEPCMACMETGVCQTCGGSGAEDNPAVGLVRR